MFSGFIPANPALTISTKLLLNSNADVVQSVVKRSDDTHEFCKLVLTELVTKLTSQTDRQAPYYKTVSLPTLILSKTDIQCTCIQRY